MLIECRIRISISPLCGLHWPGCYEFITFIMILFTDFGGREIDVRCRFDIWTLLKLSKYYVAKKQAKYNIKTDLVAFNRLMPAFF